jgi:hypothetical protein
MTSMDSWPKTRNWTLAIAALAVVVLVTYTAAAPRHGGCAFDRSSWIEATQGKFGDYEEAKPIADDLIHCDDPLYGRSRAGVQALLGERDFGGRRNPKANLWGYDIGVPGALSDYPGLQVHFDEKGRVDEVSIPGYEER